MKKILALLLIALPVLAQCETYVQIADTQFPERNSYPDCYGAAQYYSEAAECFYQYGMYSQAETYYLKAVNLYLKGAAYLLDGEVLKGKMYENAADIYAKLGDKDQAYDYYIKALEQYKLAKDEGSEERVLGKLSALSTVSLPEFTAPSQPNIIGLIALITLFVSVGLLILIPVLFKKQKVLEKEERKIEREIKKIERVVEKKEKKEKKETPKERVIKKLRKKYGIQ